MYKCIGSVKWMLREYKKIHACKIINSVNDKIKSYND